MLIKLSIYNIVYILLVHLHYPLENNHLRANFLVCSPYCFIVFFYDKALMYLISGSTTNISVNLSNNPVSFLI